MLRVVSRCKASTVEVISRAGQFPICSLWRVSDRRSEETSLCIPSLGLCLYVLLGLGSGKDALSNRELDTISLENLPSNASSSLLQESLWQDYFSLIGVKVLDYATDTVPEAICVLTGDNSVITLLAKPVHRETVSIAKLQCSQLPTDTYHR